MAVGNHRIVLENIINNLYEQRASHLHLHQYFELFVAEQVLKEYELTDEQLEEGNPGGSGDGGIDGAHLFINGTWVNHENVEFFIKQLRKNVKLDFHVIQAKYKNQLEHDVINKFSSTVEDLFDLSKDITDLEQFYNSDVIRIIETFRTAYSKLSHTFPEITVVFSYVTKGNEPNESLKHKAVRLCEKVQDDLIPGCSCIFQFIGAIALFDLYRRPPQKTFDLSTAESPISPDNSNSFITLIRLDEYFKFIVDDSGNLRSRLFEANVRDWQGENKVNSQIQQSLEDKSVKEFWWLNNGVTILAAKASHPGGKTLELENPEIVNGLQTSRAIYNHFSDPTRAPTDERKLLARIIVVPDERETREKIIKATNSQTTVPDEALRSLDNVHRTIEAYFASQEPPLYYDRRRNFYKNQGKPSSNIISIKKLAQSVIAAVLFQPDDARGRPLDYLRKSDNENDEKYLSIFNGEYPHEMYYACAQFYLRIEKTLKHKEIGEQFDASTRRKVKFYIMTYVILRHLNVSRILKSPPIHLIDRNVVAAIDDSLIISTANRILDREIKMRQGLGRFFGKRFEKSLFDELDTILPQGNSTVD